MKNDAHLLAWIEGLEIQPAPSGSLINAIIIGNRQDQNMKAFCL